MIAIICALDKELQFYYESLKEKRTHSIMGYDFIEGIINDNKVVIVKSGIGKMAAAVVTTLLIEHFNPSLVINSGIAGGYNKNLKPLDILVVNKIGCYDIDMRLDGLPFGTFNENRRFIEKDIKLEETANIHYGLIMSSDTFAGDRNKLDNIFNEYFAGEEILAVDMESFAIADVCEKYHIDWCIIRAISDVVGTESQIESYVEFATNAAKNAYLLIEKNYLKKHFS